MTSNSTCSLNEMENKTLPGSSSITCINPPNYSTCQLYQIDNALMLLSGVSLARCTPIMEQDMYSIKKLQSNESLPYVLSVDVGIPSIMTCSLCSIEFSTRSEQKEHYKSDWHRFNLKEKMDGNKPIQEAKFVEICGSISSISGSDTDTEENKSSEDASVSDVNSSPCYRSRPSALPPHIRHHNARDRSSSSASTDGEDAGDGRSLSRPRIQPKIYLRNKKGEVIALYRCVVHSKMNTPESEDHLIKMVHTVLNEMKWAIILVGGGHFAAAIFNGEDLILHKTFHRYIVRAKQGGAQVSRDNKHGGHYPQSSGASLRRYNEAAIKKDIQELLSSWSSELQTCHRIFYRAPSFNRTILFGGKIPPFKKDDSRLRTVPFPTRRATFKEIQRVHRLLATLECFGGELAADVIPASPKVHLNLKKKKSCDKSAKVENQYDKFSCGKFFQPLNEENSWLDEKFSEGESGSEATQIYESDLELIFVEETIDLTNLREFEFTRKPRKARKGKSRCETNPRRQHDPQGEEIKKSPIWFLKGEPEERYQMRNALYTSCKSGDVDMLRMLLTTLSEGTNFKNVHQNIDKKIEKIEISLDMNCLQKCSAVKDSDEDIKLETVKSDKVESYETCNNSNTFNNGIYNSKMELPLLPMKIGAFENLYSDGKVNAHKETDRQFHLLPCFSSSYTEKTEKRHLSRRHSVATASFSAFSISKNISETGETVHNHTKGTGSVPNSPRSRQQRKKNNFNNKDIASILTLDMINEAISDSGATLLHIAAKQGYCNIISLLLQYTADPTIRDKQGKTAFMVCADKETRNVFRRFMASHPEKFDYRQAEIPSPLTEEMEKLRLAKLNEKKRARKQRAKEKKAAEINRKKEEQEKQKFLSLSDREKRALAADRRYMQQLASGNGPPLVLSRCFQCAQDITGKCPFEYNSNVFCSTFCVKEHRVKSKS